MADKWYEQDWNEELVIVGLTAIAVISMLYRDVLGNEIPLSIASGLVGYLKGKERKNGK